MLNVSYTKTDTHDLTLLQKQRMKQWSPEANGCCQQRYGWKLRCSAVVRGAENHSHLDLKEARV